jgi:hypothetical protein
MRNWGQFVNRTAEGFIWVRESFSEIDTTWQGRSANRIADFDRLPVTRVIKSCCSRVPAAVSWRRCLSRNRRSRVTA